MPNWRVEYVKFGYTGEYAMERCFMILQGHTELEVRIKFDRLLPIENQWWGIIHKIERIENET